MIKDASRLTNWRLENVDVLNKSEGGRNAGGLDEKKGNKPDRATMRPDCVLTWSEIRAECVRQMDEQTEQIDKLLEYLT